ncbi:TonB-dependent receptor [Brevundimonas sp. AAP58]|uniref:TonB-dependent receptor n=1 Tax=Brevundimonas sp. AAP58 TaxID=1523422 RepID=UPI000AD182F6|nr:TonB-dependent receptor [Brevundimonas sp. AAP58]
MRFKIILLSSVCSVLGAGAAAAQSPLPTDTSPQAAQEPDRTSSVDDIIVTAQRRDTSLARTPVAVAVVSAETLQRANITSESDLRQATPGLQVRAGQSSNQLNFSLRGQSQDPYSNTRPGVLAYLNEVQISGSAGASTFYDLQSLQVLKGPQGTLFGRSATGGALLFTTVRPSEEFGGYLSALGGNYGTYKLEGAVNVPLAGDQAMLRVAAFARGRDGFQDNLFDGGTEGDQEQFGIRPSLTLQFGNSFRNDLVVDYYKSSSENTVGIISGLLPFTGGAGAPFVPTEFLYAGNRTPTAFFTGVCTIQAFAGVAAPCPPPVIPGLTDFYNGYFSDARRPSSLTQALAEQQARDPFTINSDGANRAEQDNLVVTNTSTLDLGPNATIKNIFGYADISGFTNTDADGTAFGIAQTNNRGAPRRGTQQDITQISNELQLVGTAFDTSLDYVIGAFISSEEQEMRQPSFLFDILFGGIDQVNHGTVSNDTAAIYAQGTYGFGDSGFSVTAGGRYTSEEVRKQVAEDDTFRLALGNPAPAGFDYDQSRMFEKFSYTLGVQYQATDDLLLYATHRQAYKSGGFNITVAPIVGGADIGGDGYGAEGVSDVEAGAKYNGSLGDMPFRVNFAAFYNWVEDRQSAGFGVVNGGPASVTVNVPEAEIYGFELDGQLGLTDDLTIGGNFNYTNAEFTDGDVFLLGSAVQYDQVPDTPERSAAAFVDYTVPLGAAYTLRLHADVYYQSESTISPRSLNNAGTTLPDYTLANFRFGIEDEARGIELTANLKNAFDEVYYAGGLQTGEIYQINTLIPGDPRTYTVELRYTF